MDLGLLQREIAHRLRVKACTYRLWEWGLSSPNVRARGRDVEFLGGDPTPRPGALPGRLAAARRRLGLTQVEFAARLGVEVSTPSNCEQGVTTPPPALWPRILAVLGEHARARSPPRLASAFSPSRGASV